MTPPDYASSLYRRVLHLGGLLLLLIVFVMTPCLNTAQAQNSPRRSLPSASSSDPLASLPDLPPLQNVLDYVTEHAPELKQQDAVVEGSQSQVIQARRDWMDGVTMGAEATYGTFDENQFIDQQRNPQFVDEFLFNARLRIGFNISLFDLFGRESQIDAQRAQLRADELQRDVIQQNLRSEVIDLYYNLRQARKLIEVRSQDYRSTQAHLDYVQTSFQQGSVEISEVSRVTQFASEAESRFQEARFNYLKRYDLMENLLQIDDLESLPTTSTASK